MIDGENKQPTNACNLCEIQRSHTTITPDTLILYTDGSHDSGKPQAIAGSGYVGIRNGDAEKDETNCYIEVQGAGPVVTDYKSLVYLGARKHSNNTGELRALMEAMSWALENEKKNVRSNEKRCVTFQRAHNSMFTHAARARCPDA